MKIAGLIYPLPPMEALTADRLPVPSGNAAWQYEPKWDGFRCIAYRDGTTVRLLSKSGQPLERYFPEVVERLLAVGTSRFVLDGELVVPVGRVLSFDDLLQRIHPAASRISRLAKERPAWLVVFDMLAESARTLIDKPLEKRRKALETFMAKRSTAGSGLLLSPASIDLKTAEKWLSSPGGALDGVMAKQLGIPYLSGERKGMIKVKRRRTADCVVGGFRYGSKSTVVGSLLLGLYDEAGLLHHVGFTSSFSAQERRALTPKLETLRGGPGFTGRAPGGPSRWSTERSGEWEALKPSLVVEVSYDHFSQGRFRHGAKLLRWRPDKAPKQCTMHQVEPGKGRPSLFRDLVNGGGG
jgi:ATP-dependent DNA ligase